MGSVDGRLIPSRWTPPFDGTDSSRLFKEYADAGKKLNTDAWMFGKSTTREFFPGRFIAKSSAHPEAGKFHIGGRDSKRLFITVDPDADILFTSGRLRGDNILTVVGTNATGDYLRMLELKGISYIVVENATALKDVMAVLYDKFGVRRISLQGGGIINGAMLSEGLIDGLSLVIYPGIDGLTTSPSIFEYLGASDQLPAAGQSLELVSAETSGNGIVMLYYRFHRQ